MRRRVRARSRRSGRPCGEGSDGMSTQQSVVVTGAAGALGRAVVEEFRRDGWLVIGVDRPGSPLDELAEQPGVSVVAGGLGERDRAGGGGGENAAVPGPPAP